jgi:hypothetical protein
MLSPLLASREVLLIRKVLAASACLLVIGCGNSSSSNVPVSDGGPDSTTHGPVDGGSDVEPLGDTGPAGDSGPADVVATDGQPSEGGNPPADAGSFDAGMIGDGSTPYVGRIVFAQLQQASYDYSYITIDLAAQGTLTPPLACPPGGVGSGACCYASATAADAGPPTSVSAGNIDIFDGFSMLMTIPYGAGGYAPSTTSASLWLPADQLRATASGATVQAFSGVVAAPEAPANMAPGTGTATASISTDLTVTWTPNGAGQQVMGKLLTTSHGWLQCVSEDTGTLTFPAGLMNNLTAPEMGTLELSRVTYANVSSGNASVLMAALMGGAVAVQYTP